MEIMITVGGDGRCLYGEELDLASIGDLRIRRASHVEPDALGWWWADLSPVGGPNLGPFRLRGQALEAEVTWLSERWLACSKRHGHQCPPAPPERRC